MISREKVDFGTKKACCHNPKNGKPCIYFDSNNDCIELFFDGKRERCDDGTNHYIFVKRNIFTYFIRKVFCK